MTAQQYYQTLIKFFSIETARAHVRLRFGLTWAEVDALSDYGGGGLD